MRTLRRELAERFDGFEIGDDGAWRIDTTRSEIVDTAIHAVQAWLSQVEWAEVGFVGAPAGTVGGIVKALRQQAAK